MTRLQLLLALCVAFFSNVNAYTNTRCYRINEKGVLDLFKQWTDAIVTSNPSNAVELYWDQSVLIPTLSHTLLSDNQKKLDYYSKFMLRSPTVKITEQFIDTSGCNLATFNGQYLLTITDPASGEQTTIPSHFSIAYETYDGNLWAIKQHHMSTRPNPEALDDDNSS